MPAFARGRKRGFFADGAAGPFRLLGLLNYFLEFLHPFTVLTVKLREVFIHFCPMSVHDGLIRRTVILDITHHAPAFSTVMPKCDVVSSAVAPGAGSTGRPTCVSSSATASSGCCTETSSRIEEGPLVPSAEPDSPPERAELSGVF